MAVPLVDQALLTLDDSTVARVRPALLWMRERSETDDPDLLSVRRFLWQELPVRRAGAGTERHEVAWALGDLFENAGMAEQAALCRSSSTHEILAVWRWTESFPAVPAEFWRPALSELGPRPAPPAGVGLSLASARALIDAVGEGLALTPGGLLPPQTVFALDDRFRWTEEFPWMRATGEADVPPLRFLHEHLTGQGLLAREGARLTVTAEGRAAAADDARLWWAVVDPAPRWTHEFDRDTLGVMAAALLRAGVFSPGRMTEEISHVLAAKWQPAAGGSVYDGASLVVQAWYQLGVPLGWWDTGRGPADRRPNVVGHAAVGVVFRSVARRPGPARARAGGLPA